MNDKLEKIWKERAMTDLRYYLSIYLEELMKTMKNLNQDSEYPSQDLKQAPPKHKSRVLLLDQLVRTLV
jgi:hypothetical protein